MGTKTSDRSLVRKYFYGTKGPLLLGILGTIAGIFMSGSLSTHSMGTAVIFLSILGAIVWSLFEKFGSKRNEEVAVDACIEADLSNFKERALQKLGLVNEQISIITPIKVLGPYYEYTEVKIKRSFFGQIFGFIRDLFIQKTRLVFKYGSDDEVRYSLIQAHMFFFSESQIYVYEINYDICSGDIFEESTAEYFYRDIDCVITGEKTEKIISKKKIYNKKFEFFKVIVTSGTYTYAISDGKVSILDTQVMAMRNLVRSKKEEGMSL